MKRAFGPNFPAMPQALSLVVIHVIFSTNERTRTVSHTRCAAVQATAADSWIISATRRTTKRGLKGLVR